MKLIKEFMFMLSLLAIVSCATTEKAVDSIVVEEPSGEVSSPEKNMVEVEVEETFYYVTREEAFYGDGQIDTITIYKYNNDFELVSYAQSNEQGEILESYINQIKDGRVIRKDNYGFGNVLNTYIIYTYNSDGRIETETLYDREDEVQSINGYEYEDSYVVTWRTMGPGNGVLAITSYLYDDSHNIVKIQMKDALGHIDGIIEKDYSDNFLSEERILDSKGKIENSTKYIYEGEILVEKVYFDKKNKKKRSEIYEYSESKSVPDKITLLYGSGSLEAYTMVEYDTKVVKSTILVEE